MVWYCFDDLVMPLSDCIITIILCSALAFVFCALAILVDCYLVPGRWKILSCDNKFMPIFWKAVEMLIKQFKVPQEVAGIFWFKTYLVYSYKTYLGRRNSFSVRIIGTRVGLEYKYIIDSTFYECVLIFMYSICPRSSNFTIPPLSARFRYDCIRIDPCTMHVLLSSL